VKEVKNFLELAGLKEYSVVNAADSGLASLGYEVVIWKQNN